MLKIGDKVLFKKDTQSGVIVELLVLGKVIVETIDGFKVSVLAQDLVKVEEGTDNASSYGVRFDNKDRIIKSFKKVIRNEKVTSSSSLMAPK